jgi:hypothetical protein
VNRVQRRGLINGGIAAVVTFAIGSAVVATIDLDVDEAPVSPTPSVTASPAPECDPTWEVVPSADPGEAPTTLLGVTAITTSEAWAVGGIGDPAAPTAVSIQRWDGTEWSPFQAPSPGVTVNELRAVDASEPNDVWAVGRTSNGFGDEPLVLRYDGTEWLLVELPEEIDGVLHDVVALSPDDVWAVGSVGDATLSLERAMVLHWDGQAWAVVEVRRAIGGGRSALLDIDAVSPTDLWVVGYQHAQPAIIRFDGEAWSRSETDARVRLDAIDAFESSEVWAVGDAILRFDGTEWTEVQGLPEDGGLLSVASIAGQDVWAAGSRQSDRGTTRALVLRWNGQRWAPVDGVAVGGSDALTGLDALPDGTILGVGTKDLDIERRTLGIRGTTCPPVG